MKYTTAFEIVETVWLYMDRPADTSFYREAALAVVETTTKEAAYDVVKDAVQARANWLDCHGGL